jgi:cyclopropane fatty-acyl-phospholipid synthase-like methyltransferase
MKPYSQSSEENKEPILDVLREVFAARCRVLEIGSGTGQHAVFFARQLPHLVWQPSELAENLAGIRAWLTEAGLPNVAEPLLLDIERQPWPDSAADAVFSANTVHIVSWPQVEALFAGIGALLPAGGVFALYGPFNYDGRFTSDSNARFDQWLKARDPLSGVRDFEALDALARAAGMTLAGDYAMPANNRTLVWHKTA